MFKKQTASTANEANVSLVNIVSTAIQLPGVKVSRDEFLKNQFKDASLEQLSNILEYGPVEANCDRIDLQKKAARLINERTLVSTGASFATGLPGGLAMAAAIPADMLQFYGVALRLAQEIAYLYGEGDLWSHGTVDKERITNQLILYCGVMLGSAGAAQTVRVLSSALAKQALKKIPQKALTKTFYYPIVKSIAKAFGTKMTKNVFAKGVSKAIPIIGGVVSGGITFATMRPMGMRLAETMDQAHFTYTQDAFEADWQDIVEAYEEDAIEATAEDTPIENTQPTTDDLLSKIQQAKQMLDSGIISEAEFAEIKSKLISQM